MTCFVKQVHIVKETIDSQRCELLYRLLLTWNNWRSPWEGKAVFFTPPGHARGVAAVYSAWTHRLCVYWRTTRGPRTRDDYWICICEWMFLVSVIQPVFRFLLSCSSSVWCFCCFFIYLLFLLFPRPSFFLLSV